MFKLSRAVRRTRRTPFAPGQGPTLVFRLIGYAGVGSFIYLILKTGRRDPADDRRTLPPRVGAPFRARFSTGLIRAVNWQALLVSAGGARPVRRGVGSRIAGYA